MYFYEVHAGHTLPAAWQQLMMEVGITSGVLVQKDVLVQVDVLVLVGVLVLELAPRLNVRSTVSTDDSCRTLLLEWIVWSLNVMSTLVYTTAGTID